MAKLFVTGFSPDGKGAVTCIGFYHDSTTDTYANITMNNIIYNPAISTSVRQQIQDSLATKFNESYAGQFPAVIASDIEYVS